MRTFGLKTCILLCLLFISCSEKNNPPLEYLFATIDILNLDTIDYEKLIQEHPDYASFWFSIRNECLEPQIFHYDEWYSGDSNCFYTIVGAAGEIKNRVYGFIPQ